MGRRDSDDHDHDHDHDPTMVNYSSIALLQERFRQLEKVKERREGKELLKLFSSDQRSTTSSSTAVHPHAPEYSSSIQPRLVAPRYSQRPPLQDSLSLGLNMPRRQGGDRSAVKTASFSTSSLWSEGASSTSSSFEHSDVDTSLHL